VLWVADKKDGFDGLTLRARRGHNLHPVGCGRRALRIAQQRKFLVWAAREALTNSSKDLKENNEFIVCKILDVSEERRGKRTSAVACVEIWLQLAGYMVSYSSPPGRADRVWRIIDLKPADGP
jgi:hypothetical protein